LCGLFEFFRCAAHGFHCALREQLLTGQEYFDGFVVLSGYSIDAAARIRRDVDTGAASEEQD
jgi:hypothetical protein